jgi:hypothetical protein
MYIYIYVHLYITSVEMWRGGHLIFTEDLLVATRVWIVANCG